MVLNVHRNALSVCYLGTGARPRGEGGTEVGEEGEYIRVSLHCHHQLMTCIKMGSDESHFNVSLLYC